MRSVSDVDKAIEEVHSQLVEEKESDLEYFNYHKLRYRRMSSSVIKIMPPGSKILEIGSHYLHSSMILTQLGYKIDAMDVSPFWELEFVRKREKVFGIVGIVENDLEQMKSMEGVDSRYDLILFTEIMEHITFNPISFWKSVHRIIKPGGIIYISTPNSLTLMSIVRSIKNLLTMTGIGVGVEEIFGRVTYGHHWKEYSAKEIRKYFHLLSDDFNVSIKKYHYKQYSWESPVEGTYKILSSIGNTSYIFSEELEVLVTVAKEGSWKLEPPNY
ncbi:methyltransferase domain-containing protein [Imperialibacter roseus]|uniref:Methyltransferase domain-containing protein n=1 Tax=Imperialibacter roseus TaxID=1324217 RepID=A0ABZ0IPL8_9BACT|nr:methyltransferase domain-containing protein [Imperialibacter roseus]WOK06305.1 methyltransferase domain-containing protein [Imperialibacter roseus]